MLPRTQPYQNAGSGETSAGLFEDIGTRSLQTVRIGESAGKIASGVGNAFVGVESGKESRASSFCVYAGYQAGMLSTNSSYSTILGAYAGRENRGSEVTLIGYRAGELNKDGDRIVAIGPYAMRENYSGTGSVAVGFRALERSLDGDYNVALGTEVCQDLRSGNFNTAAGYQSARASFQNSYGCYFGAFAGYSNSIGDGNCLFGFASGYNLTLGSCNVGIGPYSLYNARESSSSIAIGPYAGASMTTTVGSVIIGNNASANSSQGQYNVVIGTESGLSNEGDNNVLLGARVATNSTLSSSVVIGANAAPYIEGSGSVIIGAGTSAGITRGSSNVLLGTGADGYRATVNSAIAIGTSNTFTSTNSISIGDDIVNERASSILLGYQLKSDANNSVIMGNDINIQSVIYWKDPLNDALKDTVRADAIGKLGISNITYGASNQVLKSPTGEAYLYATVGLITSNIYNSATSPQSFQTSPLTYDLRTAVSPCNYLLASGVSVPLRSDADLAGAPIPFHGLLSNIDSSISLSNIQGTSTLRNATVARSAFLTRHSSNITLTVSPAVINVIDVDSASATVSVAVPKRAAAFHSPISASNVVHPYPILTSAPLISTIGLPALQQSAEGITNIPNSSIQYAVIQPPTLGKLNAAKYGAASNIQYTPFKEATFATQDIFTLRPVREIIDASQDIYGLPSSNDVTVNINIASPSQIYYAPELVSFDHAPITLTSNMLRSIPTSIAPSTPLRITDIGSNSTVTIGASTYTSNDIALMVSEQIYQYPDSLYSAYLASARAHAEAVSLSNTAAYASTYGATFSTTIPDLLGALSNDIVSLSNITWEVTIDPNDFTETSNAIVTFTPPDDPIILGLSNVATNSVLVADPSLLPNAYSTYSNVFTDWVTSYDPSQLYPQIQTIASCNLDFETNYLLATPFLYDQSVSAYATSTSTASTSNDLRTATNTISEFLTMYPETTVYSTYATLASSIQEINTLVHKYYEVPRLFLTYDDILRSHLTLTTTSDVYSDHVTVEVGTPNAPLATPTFPINIYASSTWEAVPNVQPTLTLPRTKTIASLLDQRVLTNAEQADVFFESYPSHGLVTFDASSNAYYSLINPWIANITDTAVLVMKDVATHQTADTRINVQVDNGVAYETSLLMPYTPPSSNLTQNYTTIESITETLVPLSNVAEITTCNIDTLGGVSQSNYTIVSPIGAGEYSPLKGTVFATSNIFTSNVLIQTFYEDLFDEFGSNLNAVERSNVYQFYYDTTYTEYQDGSYISQTFTPTTSNFVVNLGCNVSVTSNITLFETRVIEHYYTRQYDTFTERVAFDTSHYFHFASNEPTYYLYANDGDVVARPSQHVETTTTTSLASRTSVSVFTSNIILHSNVNIAEPLFPLSRHVIYQGDPTAVISYTPNAAIDVVRSNVGPIQAFTQADLDQAQTWLRLKSPTPAASPTTLSFTVNNTSVPIPSTISLVPTGSITYENMGSYTLLLNNQYQTCNLPVWDDAIIRTGLPFTPERIHIETLQAGAMHDTAHFGMTFAFSNREVIHYVATSNTITADRLAFYFSSNQEVASSKYVVDFVLSRDPYLSGQDVNMGLSYMSSNVLTPNGFVTTRNGLPLSTTDIQVTTTQNVALSKARFTLAEVQNNSIYLKTLANDVGSFTYNVYNRSTSELLASDLTFAVRPYYHVGFPARSQITDAQIRLETIGNNGHVSNILMGPLWSYIADLKTPYQGRVSPAAIDVCFTSNLSHGFLWDETLNQRLPICIPWKQFQEHRIHYIPYNPNYIPNETVGIKLLYENAASPEYTTSIKNYTSRFPALTIDPTVRAPEGRQINLNTALLRSQGLIADGFTWYPNSTIQVAQQTKAPLQTTLIQAQLSNVSSAFATAPLSVTPYTHSYPLDWSSTDMFAISIDEADRWNLAPLLSRVSCNVFEERDITFYLNTPPKYGLLLNKSTKSNVVYFRDTDLQVSNIIYQHLGGNTSNDLFSIGLASTPYDLTVNEVAVNVHVRSMPRITSNVELFVYHSNISDATTTTHSLSSNIYTEGAGYMHVFNTNVDIPSIFTTTTPVGFRIPSSYFANHGSNAPFPALTMELVPNNTPPIAGAPYINPLAQEYANIYKKAFSIPFTAHLNRYVSSNIIPINQVQEAEQLVAYDIDRTLSASSNLAGRIVTYFLQVRPENSIFDEPTLTPLQIQQTEFLRTYNFQLSFVGTEAELFTVDFYQDRIVVQTPSSSTIVLLSSAIIWDFASWHNFLFVNEDPDNQNYASLYINYDVTQSRVQNAARNVLQEQQIAIADLGVLKHIYLRANMQSSSNYAGEAVTFARNDAQAHGALGTFFELQNARTKLQFRNQEVFITTYTISETETGIISASESLNHNVVIGKDITVRGVNNICVGNRFVTSGKNSIIVGNDIGSGIVDATTINDVYESIVIGNESFQNSIVRDVISIGNRNLNNLFQSPVEKVNEFLSQRPILIGNDISQDKLDFSINVGNAFAKTTIGGPQIYVGLQKEIVGIGYTSNVPLSNEHQLYVNGSIFAEGTITCCNLVLTGQVTTNVNVTQSNTDRLSIINTGVGPAFQVIQYGTQPAMQIYNNNTIALTVASGGNVGVGLLNPSYKLEVAGDINLSGNLLQNGVPFTSGRTTSNADLLTEGTLDVARLPDTGVVADVYGSSTSIPILTIDAKGRVTEASNTSFSLAPSASIDTTNADNITTGTLSLSRLPVSGVTAATYGSSAAIPVFNVDDYGRVLTVTNTSISITTSAISGLAPSATTDTTNATNLTTGTLNANLLPNTGVVPGTYGSASIVPRVIIDAKGRVTSVTNTNIAIAANAVTGLVASATIDTTNATNITSGTLNFNRLPASGVTGGSYGASNLIPAFQVDAKGRVTSVTNTTITITSSDVTGLAPSATIDTTNAANITSGKLASNVFPYTGVSASTYGTSNLIPKITIDATGRITTASNIPLAVTVTDITGLAPSATIDTTNATNINSGTLSATFLESSGVNAGSYGSSNSVPAFSVDTKGRVTSVTITRITLSTQDITGLAPSATVDATNATNITSGTLDVARLADTGVTVSEYGSSNTVAAFQVDAKGRVMSASNVSIHLMPSNITGLAPSATVDTTNAANIASGTLDASRLSVSGVNAGSYGMSNKVPAVTVDAKGRIVSASNVPISLVPTDITGLAASATIDTTNAANISSGTLNTTRLPASGVAANTYGSESNVPVITVDTYGRVTQVGTSNIAIQAAAVSGLAPSATIDATNATNIASGTLDVNRLASSGVTAGAYGASNFVATLQVDGKGRVTLASNVQIAINATNVSGLAPSATIDTTNATNITTGTLANARLPSAISVTTVSADGSSLSNLNATLITSGTLANARLPSAISVATFSGDGSSLSNLNASLITSGTLNNARLPPAISVATVAADGSSLSNLNATLITSGTLNNTRLPANIYVATLSGDGASLSNLNATLITSGTLNNARLPSSISVATFSGDGASLSNLNATFLTSGTLANARLPPAFNVSTLAETVVVNSTGVGIGISPQSKLHVNGDILSTGTLTASNLVILGDYVTMNTVTSNTENLVVNNAGTGPAFKVIQSGNNVVAAFYDAENVNPALFIADGGNVGMGTDNPLTKLQVIGTVSATQFSGSAETLSNINATFITSGTLNNARLPANISVATFSGVGSSLSNLNATLITSGTLNNARLPANISVATFSGDGASLSNLNATLITTGTLNNARLPAAISVSTVSADGSSLSNLNATLITSGTLNNARLPANISVATFSGDGASLSNLNATLITSGTLSQSRLPLSGVVAGVYGASNTVSQLTLDATGRVTLASNVPIVIPSTSVTGLAPSATTDTTNATNITSGTLDTARLAVSGVTSGTYGTSNFVATFQVDTKGRVTFASNVPIVIGSSSVTGLAPSATTDTTNATNITSGTLNSSRLPASGVIAGVYGASNIVSQLTVDASGRVTLASNVPIIIPSTSVTGLAPSATTDTTSATNITSGTLDANRLALSGVSAGAYGSSNNVATFTVDTKGRVTLASNVPIVIGSSSVTGLAPSATVDTTNATNITSGTLDANRLAVSGVSVGSYGGSNVVPVLTVDSKGRITFATTSNIAITSSAVSGLAPSATTDTTNATNITSGTLDANRLAASGVSAGSYGSSNTVATFSVDTKGRLTIASNVQIAITASAVSGLATVATSGSYSNLSDVPFLLTNANTDAYYAKTGNVGIGTTQANYKLHVEGKIFASSSITAYSDQRVKTNIQTIPHSLDIVKRLRGVSYDRVDTGEHEIGLIAQEVAEVLPEVVTEAPNGKSIAYGNMVAVLLEAVKTLSARVEELETIVKKNNLS